MRISKVRTYRRKPSPLKAIQWTGTDESLEAIQKFTGVPDEQIVVMPNTNNQLRVGEHPHRIMMMEGDFVKLHLKGYPELLAKDRFKNTHEEMKVGKKIDE